MLASIANDLFTMGVPVADKALRVAGVYLGLLLLLRLAGKRDLAQLNTFDLIVLLLLSNVVQNAIIGPDNSLVGGLIGAFFLITGNSLLVRWARTSDRWTALLEGTPTPIVTDGQVDHAAVARLGLRDADVLAALRRQGADDVTDVASAALEPGGAVLLHLRPDAMDATKGDIARLEAKLDRLLARG